MIKKERKIDMDDLKQQAIILFKEYPESISVSLLQRHLRIGVIKANKIIESLENDNIISKRDKNGKRNILIS